MRVVFVEDGVAGVGLLNFVILVVDDFSRLVPPSLNKVAQLITQLKMASDCQKVRLTFAGIEPLRFPNFVECKFIRSQIGTYKCN